MRSIKDSLFLPLQLSSNEVNLPNSLNLGNRISGCCCNSDLQHGQGLPIVGEHHIYNPDGSCEVIHDDGSSTYGTTSGSGGDKRCVKDGRVIQA